MGVGYNHFTILQELKIIEEEKQAQINLKNRLEKLKKHNIKMLLASKASEVQSKIAQPKIGGYEKIWPKS